MDLVGLRAGRSSTRIVARLPRLRRSSSASTTSRAIPMSALRGRQRHRAAARTCPGITGPTLMRPPRDGRRRRPTAAAEPVPPAGAVGEPPQPRFPRLRRHDRRRRGAARATRSRVAAVRPREHASRASSRTDGDLPTAVAGAGGHARRSTDEIDISRGDVLVARRRPRRRSPTSSRPRSSGWPRSRCCPGRPYLMKIGTQHGARPPSPSPSTRSTSTRSSTWRPRRSSSTRSASCNVCARPAGRLRPLRRQPRHRRLHPDRPAHQRHRRRRHAATSRCAAPHNIHWQALDVDKARARRAEGPEAVRAVVHRPVGRGQVDHRQPGREAAARAGPRTPTCSTATTSATA